MREYIQRMAVFNIVWSKQLNMHQGANLDVNIARIFAIFSIDDCEASLVTFPGQEYTWTSQYVNDQGKTCVDLDAEFGELWTATKSLKHNQYYTLPYMAFDIFDLKFEGTMITLTVPLFND